MKSIRKHDFMDLIYNKGVFPLITKPTRITNTSSTFIDNIFTNDFNHHKELFVKHEQAPTIPKLEGVWFFVDFEYIFYENRYFWPI